MRNAKNATHSHRIRIEISQSRRIRIAFAFAFCEAVAFASHSHLRTNANLHPCAELNLSPGNYPVPESCCEQQSKFCGLENAILKKKLPKQIYPPVNTPNICLSNSTVPINSTVPFNTSECLPINTSTYSTPTSTDKLIENVVDNIFTEGCFPNLFEKLKSVEWLPTVLFGHVVVLLNLFLNVLFGCLMCCVSSDKPMRHVKYGKKHKVPVSRRL